MAPFEAPKKSIIITSYNFAASLTDERELFHALRQASSRNVRVQIYFNLSQLNETMTQFLTESRIELIHLKVHSKILAIDDEALTCGSFDWLGSRNSLRIRKDSSLILKGKSVPQLIKNIEKGICTYRTLSLNPRITRSIEERFQKLHSFLLQFCEDVQIELLTTPQHHDRFLKESFNLAQREIELYVPFVTSSRDRLREILPLPILKHFLNSGKKLTIFYRLGDQNITLLQNYIQELESDALVLSHTDNLHRKSLCIDGIIYVEGSYNWLSSARNILDPNYLMETSIILRERGYINNLIN